VLPVTWHKWSHPA